MKNKIRDALGLLGLASLTAGLALQYGPGVALIGLGSLLLATVAASIWRGG